MQQALVCAQPRKLLAKISTTSEASVEFNRRHFVNEEIITIIRANGSTAIPLVAGFNWAYDLTPIAMDPINAEGIAYVSHPYPMKREKPWEAKWTSDWGFAAEKYPVILTEIGFCGADEKGAHVPVISDESYGEAITNYCREKGIA